MVARRRSSSAATGRSRSALAFASNLVTVLLPPAAPSGAAVVFSATVERHLRNVALLPDAELAEDQVEDVVGGGGAGDGIEGAESAVEIEQQHFVRDFRVYGTAGGVERCD